MGEIATIGYEGASLEDFIGTLIAAKISTLIDVRELPMSRRKGFSKRALSEALAESGIEYLHLKSLGDPKEGREAARSGDFEKFRKIYAQQLKTDAAQAQLLVAIDSVQSDASCLMCYERNPSDCHRKIVAKEISDRIGFEVKHLGVQPLAIAAE